MAWVSTLQTQRWVISARAGFLPSHTTLAFLYVPGLPPPPSATSCSLFSFTPPPLWLGVGFIFETVFVFNVMQAGAERNQALQRPFAKDNRQQRHCRNIKLRQTSKEEDSIEQYAKFWGMIVGSSLWAMSWIGMGTHCRQPREMLLMKVRTHTHVFAHTHWHTHTHTPYAHTQTHTHAGVPIATSKPLPFPRIQRLPPLLISTTVPELQRDDTATSSSSSPSSAWTWEAPKRAALFRPFLVSWSWTILFPRLFLSLTENVQRYLSLSLILSLTNTHSLIYSNIERINSHSRTSTSAHQHAPSCFRKS